MPPWIVSAMLIIARIGEYAAVRTSIEFVRSPEFVRMVGWCMVFIGLVWQSIPFLLVGGFCIYWYNRPTSTPPSTL